MIIKYTYYKMVLKIYTDGASRGNPGESGAGAMVYQEGIELMEISKYLGKKTNNEAEYLAVLESIKFMIENKYQNAIFYSDSQLLVNQMKGKYKVKAPTIIPIFNEIKALSQNLDLEFNWIPREENSKADELANRAIDAN